MNTIRRKKQLSENVFLMEIEDPIVANHRRAGQFVIVMVDEECGERIPLTIADANREAGTITIIFQTVGATTTKLSRLDAGDRIPAVLGPLGRPTNVTGPGKRIVCVGGGIGVAPLHPIAEAFREAGNEVSVIMGARTKELLIMKDEMNRISEGRLTVVTDDGSEGRKCLVTEPLKEMCETNPPDEVIVIGPPVMMKFCALTTKPFGVKTTVSLNTVMIDGTGMCGGCRVNVGGEMKFVCLDGPEFDGHLVDWDMMLKRMATFKPQEVWAKDHVCNMLKGAQ